MMANHGTIKCTCFTQLSFNTLQNLSRAATSSAVYHTSSLSVSLSSVAALYPSFSVAPSSSSFLSTLSSESPWVTFHVCYRRLGETVNKQRINKIVFTYLFSLGCILVSSSSVVTSLSPCARF